MDDIDAIRRKNLRAALAEKAEGNQSQLTRLLDKDNPSLINRYLNGKPIGDDFARELEEKLGYERNWMDNVHDRKISIHHREVSPEGADLAVEWEKLADPQRTVVWTLVHVLTGAQKRGEISESGMYVAPQDNPRTRKKGGRPDRPAA